jgi:hypothetical protein
VAAEAVPTEVAEAPTVAVEVVMVAAAVVHKTVLTLAAKAILAVAHLSQAAKIHSCSAQMQDAAAADRKFLLS